MPRPRPFAVLRGHEDEATSCDFLDSSHVVSWCGVAWSSGAGLTRSRLQRYLGEAQCVGPGIPVNYRAALASWGRGLHSRLRYRRRAGAEVGRRCQPRRSRPHAAGTARGRRVGLWCGAGHQALRNSRESATGRSQARHSARWRRTARTVRSLITGLAQTPHRTVELIRPHRRSCCGCGAGRRAHPSTDAAVHRGLQLLPLSLRRWHCGTLASPHSDLRTCFTFLRRGSSSGR